MDVLLTGDLELPEVVVADRGASPRFPRLPGGGGDAFGRGCGGFGQVQPRWLRRVLLGGVDGVQIG